MYDMFTIVQFILYNKVYISLIRNLSIKLLTYIEYIIVNILCAEMCCDGILLHFSQRVDNVYRWVMNYNVF